MAKRARLSDQYVIFLGHVWPAKLTQSLSLRLAGLEIFLQFPWGDFGAPFFPKDDFAAKSPSAVLLKQGRRLGRDAVVNGRWPIHGIGHDIL